MLPIRRRPSGYALFSSEESSLLNSEESLVLSALDHKIVSLEIHQQVRTIAQNNPHKFTHKFIGTSSGCSSYSLRFSFDVNERIYGLTVYAIGTLLCCFSCWDPQLRNSFMPLINGFLEVNYSVEKFKSQ